jgi:hypothetical protein
MRMDVNTATATMTSSNAVATATSTQSIADYLAQLLKDKKQLAAFPNVFVHMERLLDDGKSSKWVGLRERKKRKLSFPSPEKSPVYSVIVRLI